MTARDIRLDVLDESKRRTLAEKDDARTITPGVTNVTSATDPEADDAPDDDNRSNVPESFQPVDLAAVIAGGLVQPVPTMLTRRGDGITSGLIYPGVVNGLHGDSGIGKSWTAVLLIRERLAAGESVMLLDLEDTPVSVVSRMRLIGVPDGQTVGQLVYIRPTDEFTPMAMSHLLGLIAERAITAVVIDSLGEAFGTEGINEDRDNEVGPWLRSVARVLAAAGPAVVLIDHSTKTADNKLHPSGSKRKRAAIGGASYLVEAVTGFVKGGGGRLRLTCAKDRHGTYRRGEHVAWLDMDTAPDGTVTLELVAPAPAIDEGDAYDVIGNKVVTIIYAAEKPVSMTTVRGLVRAAKVKISNSALDDCIALQVHRGALAEAEGPRKARLFSAPEVGNE
jgi:hypothetical protein